MNYRIYLIKVITFLVEIYVYIYKLEYFPWEDSKLSKFWLHGNKLHPNQNPGPDKEVWPNTNCVWHSVLGIPSQIVSYSHFISESWHGRQAGNMLFRTKVLCLKFGQQNLPIRPLALSHGSERPRDAPKTGSSQALLSWQ